MHDIQQIIETLVYKGRLFSRSDVNAKPCPVPQEPGLYAWFFNDIPDTVPTENCYGREGWKLLYIGIARSSLTSKATLRNRIKGQHLNGNCYGSTLRRTLAVVLEKQLGVSLQKIGSRTFLGDGEELLNTWLDTHARVSFLALDQPWQVEADLIKQFDLPLNLQHNEGHPFHSELLRLRAEAQKRAFSQ